MNKAAGVSLVDSLHTAIQIIVDQYAKQWLFYKDMPVPMSHQLLDSSRVAQTHDRVLVPDRHMFTEIFICLEGSCAMQIENQYFCMAKGCVAIILPDTLHNELPQKSGRYVGIWITLGMDRCMLHLSGKDESSGFYTVEGQLIRNNSSYNLLLDEISIELNDPSELSQEMAKSYFVQLLISAYREMRDRNTAPEHKGAWKESIVLAVKKYIENNYSKPISLDAIAHETYMSVNYLNTLFKSVEGKTINQYINEYKIDKAKFLLTSTNEPIQSIANDLGYYDQYHFSNSFKKACGVSPSNYREEQ